MPKNLNLAKADKAYYSAGKKPTVVEFGPLSYLTLVGQGEPAGEEFVQKVEALYPLAYGVRKRCKQQGNVFTVPKLEGLWWTEGGEALLDVDRSAWHWKLLIRMPDFVDQEAVDAVQEPVASKKKDDLINTIEFEQITEGKCVQMMHIGPYTTEKKTVAALQSFVEENGMTVDGLHHEIYLSDPRKTEPERLKNDHQVFCRLSGPFAESLSFCVIPDLIRNLCACERAGSER